MILRQLFAGCLPTRVINATAAGTTTVNGSSVDMLGFESVAFVVGLGTLTATQGTSIKLQGSADNSTWVDLAGTNPYGSGNHAPDGDSNKVVIAEAHRVLSPYRYVRGVVVRGTANAVIDFGFMLQFNAQRDPVMSPSTGANLPSTVSAYSANFDVVNGTP